MEETSTFHSKPPIPSAHGTGHDKMLNPLPDILHRVAGCLRAITENPASTCFPDLATADDWAGWVMRMVRDAQREIIKALAIAGVKR